MDYTYYKKGGERKSLLSGVGFETMPKNVDQKTRQSLKSGAFDRSANLTSIGRRMSIQKMLTKRIPLHPFNL